MPIRRAPRTSSAPTARGHVSARRGDRAAMTSAYRIASRCACLVLLAAAGPCAPAPTAGQRGALADARCGSASAGAGAHLEAAADVGEATAAVRPRVQCLLKKGAQRPHHGRAPRSRLAHQTAQGNLLEAGSWIGFALSISNGYPGPELSSRTHSPARGGAAGLRREARRGWRRSPNHRPLKRSR